MTERRADRDFSRVQQQSNGEIRTVVDKFGKMHTYRVVNANDHPSFQSGDRKMGRRDFNAKPRRS